MKKNSAFAILGSLCLLLTACGGKDSSAAGSAAESVAESINETTTASASDPAGTTTAETTTTAVSTEQTADTSSAAETTVSADTTSATSAGGNQGGGSGGFGASLVFRTPEEALDYTFDTFLFHFDAEHLLRGLPEKLLNNLTLGSDQHITPDEIKTLLQKSIEEDDNRPESAEFSYEILKRVSPDEAYKGMEDEEESRADLKEECEDYCKVLAEIYGCSKDSVRYEILHIRATKTENGEKEIEEDFFPVFSADGTWVDYLLHSYVVLSCVAASM